MDVTSETTRPHKHCFLYNHPTANPPLPPCPSERDALQPDHEDPRCHDVLISSNMTRTSKRSSNYLGYRSPKRRKTTPSPPIYTTREVPWEEQLELPYRFHKDGKGVWPALKILKERVVGDQKEYLVDWEAHPTTGELFKPTWEPKSNVGQRLLRPWRKAQGELAQKQEHTTRSSEPPPTSVPSRSNGIATKQRAGRRANTRRVIQDSSSDIQSDPGGIDDSTTPTLASSPASSDVDSVRPRSPVAEILETQQPQNFQSITVHVPHAAIDKAEYESVRSTQLSLQDTATFDCSSPLAAPFSNTSSRSLRFTNRFFQQHSRSTFIERNSNPLSLAHRNLAEAVSSQASFTSQHSVAVPQSSEHSGSRSSRGAQSSGTNPGLIIHESSPLTVSPDSQRRISKGPRPDLTHKSPHSPHPTRSQRSSQFQLSHKAEIARPGRRLSAESALLSSGGGTTASGSSSGLQPIQAPTQRSQASPLWEFPSQIPYQTDSSGRLELFRSPQSQKRHFLSFKPSRLQVDHSPPGPQRSSADRAGLSASNMSGQAARQSPRPRPATPASSARSPQPVIRDRVRRARSHQGSQDQYASLNETTNSGNATLSPNTRGVAEADNHVHQGFSSRQHSSFNAMQVDHPELASGTTSQPSVYDTALGASSFPIHQSIEDEPPSSAEEHHSIASKASSSQQSLENERLVPQVDGVTLPVHPVLGPAEYTIALPAEGKIQSTYMDTIKSKRKSLLKFIRRRDSVGSANGSTNRTLERNEMIELVQRLHDTTTHLDLGLPGFSTQYSIRSDKDTAYANYAGSKFAFLGHLVDVLARVDCGLVIASQTGHVQDLLEDYLTMKHVSVQRHDRPLSPQPRVIDPRQGLVKVDLISTSPNSELHIRQRPILLIAFDSSFDNQEPHITRIRELNSTGRNQLLPVLHLLVTNSSEHIDRCLRKSMPSPQRLKILVRGTYQARKYLGGSPTYVPHPSDEPEGRPMDLSDLQKAVRKSPDRKLAMVANIVARAAISEDFENHWNLNGMPEVQYDELEEATPKTSEASTAAHTAAPTPRDGRARSRTPVSRAGTPSGRKRFLEIEGTSPTLIKRQRLTPLRDVQQPGESSKDQPGEVEHLKQMLKRVQEELSAERDARKKAEDEKVYVQNRLDEFTSSLAALQRRYEKRMTKCHELEKTNKALLATMENGKARQEKTAKDNVALKVQLGQLQSDLANARSDLKSTGGDVAALEVAREEARTATAKSHALEKSLENTKRDFEFTRQQYQQASNKAAELGSQNGELESEVAELKVLAGQEKRRLKEMNFHDTTQRHLAKIAELELEKKGQLALLKKMEDEVKGLKKNRGVQTRGSSVQPGSPGPRSRQGSPAPGLLLPPSAHAGNRASVLRHER